MKELTIPTIEKAFEEKQPSTFFHRHSNLYMTWNTDPSISKFTGLGKSPEQSKQRWYDRNVIENTSPKNSKPDPHEAIGISNKSQPERDLES